MYSQKHSKQNLDAIQKTLPFTLKYHTNEQIDKAIRILDEKKQEADESGKPLRLTRTESEFIANETLLCKWSFRYYVGHYCWIKSKLFAEPGVHTEPIIRFQPNIAQRIIMDIWASEEIQYHPIMMMQLKARQLGVTTLTQLAIAHRVQFHSAVDALVASSTEGKTREMANKMLLTWSRQPWWLFPQNCRGPLESGQLLVEFRDLNSAVTLQWGNQISGIARGRTPDITHLSEIPEWTCDPWQAIDASLMRAFHPDPSSFMVWESTAAGIGERNFWFKKWYFLLEEFAKGTASMYPVFLPWYVGTDVWPTRTWKAQHDTLLEIWQPEPHTVAHAESAKRYVASSPLLRKHLIDKPNALRKPTEEPITEYHMPRIQQLFWELERSQAKSDHKMNLFHQEMPATPDEAFQNTKMSVFEIEEIEEWLADIQNPVAIYAITGTGIREEFAPPRKYIDPEGKRFTISFTAQTLTDEITTARLNFNFIPLKRDNWREIDPNGRLFIWREPTENDRYHIGCDVSYGVDQDRSIIAVMNEATLVTDAIQCAEYANSKMNSVAIASIALAVGLYYRVKVEGETINPQMDIECNANGEATQQLLKVIGWDRFHRWERYDTRKRMIQNKLGWFTTGWSRPLVIDHVNNAIRDRRLRINSPWLIGELKTLEKDWDEAYSKAAKGAHDDRYIGLGIAYFCAHVWHMVIKGVETVFQKRERVNAAQSSGNFETYMIGSGMDTALPTLGDETPDSYWTPTADIYGDLVSDD